MLIIGPCNEFILYLVVVASSGNKKEKKKTFIKLQTSFPFHTENKFRQGIIEPIFKSQFDTNVFLLFFQIPLILTHLNIHNPLLLVDYWSV